MTKPRGGGDKPPAPHEEFLADREAKTIEAKGELEDLKLRAEALKKKRLPVDASLVKSAERALAELEKVGDDPAVLEQTVKQWVQRLGGLRKRIEEIEIGTSRTTAPGDLEAGAGAAPAEGLDEVEKNRRQALIDESEKALRELDDKITVIPGITQSDHALFQFKANTPGGVLSAIQKMHETQAVADQAEFNAAVKAFDLEFAKLAKAVEKKKADTVPIPTEVLDFSETGADVTPSDVQKLLEKKGVVNINYREFLEDFKDELGPLVDLIKAGREDECKEFLKEKMVATLGRFGATNLKDARIDEMVAGVWQVIDGNLKAVQAHADSKFGVSKLAKMGGTMGVVIAAGMWYPPAGLGISLGLVGWNLLKNSGTLEKIAKNEKVKKATSFLGRVKDKIFGKKPEETAIEKDTKKAAKRSELADQLVRPDSLAIIMSNQVRMVGSKDVLQKIKDAGAAQAGASADSENQDKIQEFKDAMDTVGAEFFQNALAFVEVEYPAASPEQKINMALALANSLRMYGEGDIAMQAALKKAKENGALAKFKIFLEKRSGAGIRKASESPEQKSARTWEIMQTLGINAAAQGLVWLGKESGIGRAASTAVAGAGLGLLAGEIVGGKIEAKLIKRVEEDLKKAETSLDRYNNEIGEGAARDPIVQEILNNVEAFLQSKLEGKQLDSPRVGILKDKVQDFLSRYKQAKEKVKQTLEERLEQVAAETKALGKAKGKELTSARLITAAKVGTTVLGTAAGAYLGYKLGISAKHKAEAAAKAGGGHPGTEPDQPRGAGGPAHHEAAPVPQLRDAVDSFAHEHGLTPGESGKLHEFFDAHKGLSNSPEAKGTLDKIMDASDAAKTKHALHDSILRKFIGEGAGKGARLSTAPEIILAEQKLIQFEAILRAEGAGAAAKFLGEQGHGHLDHLHLGTGGINGFVEQYQKTVLAGHEPTDGSLVSRVFRTLEARATVEKEHALALMRQHGEIKPGVKGADFWLYEKSGHPLHFLGFDKSGHPILEGEGEMRAVEVSQAAEHVAAAPVDHGVLPEPAVLSLEDAEHLANLERFAQAGQDFNAGIAHGEAAVRGLAHARGISPDTIQAGMDKINQAYPPGAAVRHLGRDEGFDPFAETPKTFGKDVVQGTLDDDDDHGAIIEHAVKKVTTLHKFPAEAAGHVAGGGGGGGGNLPERLESSGRAGASHPTPEANGTATPTGAKAADTHAAPATEAKPEATGIQALDAHGLTFEQAKNNINKMFAEVRGRLQRVDFDKVPEDHQTIFDHLAEFKSRGLAMLKRGTVDPLVADQSQLIRAIGEMQSGRSTEGLNSFLGALPHNPEDLKEWQLVLQTASEQPILANHSHLYLVRLSDGTYAAQFDAEKIFEFDPKSHVLKVFDNAGTKIGDIPEANIQTHSSRASANAQLAQQ